MPKRTWPLNYKTGIEKILREHPKRSVRRIAGAMLRSSCVLIIRCSELGIPHTLHFPGFGSESRRIRRLWFSNTSGTNLKHTTGVTFNGTRATFKIVSKSEIKTNVPEGATTGKVKVSTPNGTLTSNVNFRVP